MRFPPEMCVKNAKRRPKIITAFMSRDIGCSGPAAGPKCSSMFGERLRSRLLHWPPNVGDRGAGRHLLLLLPILEPVPEQRRPSEGQRGVCTGSAQVSAVQSVQRLLLSKRSPLMCSHNFARGEPTITP